MVDSLSSAQRSQIMARIKGKDTAPELLIRRGLHRMGFRYRLHDRRLPGRPDLVFPKLGAIIFVHGCFWHGHNCHLYRVPGTRPEFWTNKIKHNRQNDGEVRLRLRSIGWRQLVIWECALRGKEKLPRDAVIDLTAAWLRGSSFEEEIRGRRHRHN